MRYYLDHMINKGIELDPQWTGDCLTYCEIDGVVYPHLIMRAVKHYKMSNIIEMKCHAIYRELTAIKSEVLFDVTLREKQDELRELIFELDSCPKKSTRSASRETLYSEVRTQQIVDKANNGEHLSEAEFNYIKNNAWSVGWKFRGTPEQLERMGKVKFTCSDLGI